MKRKKTMVVVMEMKAPVYKALIKKTAVRTNTPIIPRKKKPEKNQENQNQTRRRIMTRVQKVNLMIIAAKMRIPTIILTTTTTSQFKRRRKI